MSARILDGNAVAEGLKAQVKARAKALKDAGRTVHLTAILVGASPAAELYAKKQADTCAAVGIDYELRKVSGDEDQAALIDIIERLNEDLSVTGIMLHLPLPKQLNATGLQNRIAPMKDVEGVGAANLGYILAGQPLLVPCTAMAAFELVKSTGVAIRGTQAVVVGASAIVGKPVALLLSDERATVSICRSATSNLAEYCRQADILVAAVGKANMLGAAHVKEGAVVIDVGINRITLGDGTKKTVGDVDFEAARQKAGHITPVPGGVGPVTVAILLRNTVRSAELMAGG